MSVVTLEPDWQQRRSRFSHDLLKNEYLPALSRFLNILNDRIEDEVFERSFVTDVFPRWESRNADVSVLIEEFEVEMSPRCLLDRLPLLRRRTQHEPWLSNLVHTLWCSRHPVAEWVRQSQEIADLTNQSYVLICQELKASPDIGDAGSLRHLTREFSKFRDRCHELATAIEKFPRKILVT